MRVGVDGCDVEPATQRFGADPVQGTPSDIVGGDGPTLLGQPHRVAAFTRTHVECPADRGAAELGYQRTVRIAAPHLLTAVTVVPVDLVAGRAGGGPEV